MCITRPQTYQY